MNKHGGDQRGMGVPEEMYGQYYHGMDYGQMH